MRILSRWMTAAAMLCLSGAATAASPWLLPNFSDRIELQVRNSYATRLNRVIVLSVHDVAVNAPGFPGTFALAMQPEKGGAFLPMQIDDLDGDGTPDEVAVQVDVPAHTSAPIEIYYSSTLHDSVPWPHAVHASHAYGYNTATAAIESSFIGYRTYGGLLFDVQAHSAGQSGLFNSLLGYSRTSSPPREGRDIVHYGQTLGLGGLYLQEGDAIYRPPFNTPTYSHRPAASGEPVYRIVADGPIRAIVRVDLPAWQAGENRLAVQGIYEMRAGDEVLRATLHILPGRIAAGTHVGIGVLTLPRGTWRQTPEAVLVDGTQDDTIGELALGIGFDPAVARSGGIVQTPGGTNRAVQFMTALSNNEPVTLQYQMAATWSRTVRGKAIDHLQTILQDARKELEIISVQHAATPAPQALEGEPL